jgi:hypothetical protein
MIKEALFLVKKQPEGIAVLFTARGVEYAENRPFYWQIWRFAVSSAVKIFY